MASSTNTEKSSPINNGSNNNNNQITVDTPATGAAVNSPNGRRSKKPKHDSSGGDHRKEREEWSDTAISILLDAFTDKYMALNKSNLRGKDWEVVCELVGESCDNNSNRKSIEQCKNKIDNLKKRYKLETQRIESKSNGSSVSTWIWFGKMDLLFGNSTAKSGGGGVEDEGEGDEDDDGDDGDDRSVGVSSGNRLRRSARFVFDLI